MTRRLLDSLFVVAVCAVIVVMAVAGWQTLHNPQACWTAC